MHSSVSAHECNIKRKQIMCPDFITSFILVEMYFVEYTLLLGGLHDYIHIVYVKKMSLCEGKEGTNKEILLKP